MDFSNTLSVFSKTYEFVLDFSNTLLNFSKKYEFLPDFYEF